MKNACKENDMRRTALDILSLLPPTIYFNFLIHLLSKSTIVIALPFFMEHTIKLALSVDGRETLLQYLIIFFLIMMALEIISLQNYKRSYTAFNAIRRDLTMKINFKFMSMDYEDFECSDRLDAAFMAYNATLSNDNGIEGIYHSLFDLGWKLFSVIFLMGYLLSESIAIGLVILVTVVLSLYLSVQEKKINLDSNADVNKIKRKLVYFTYDNSDYSYGKEKRIYNLSNHVKAMYDGILNNFIALLNKIDNSKLHLFTLDELIMWICSMMIFFILFRKY